MNFTWRRDHEPNKVTELHIVFGPMGGGGTRLLLEHGTYGEGDSELKQSHLELDVFYSEVAGAREKGQAR